MVYSVTYGRQIIPRPSLNYLKKALKFLICGTGAWVTEMSKNYPLTKFTGVDILHLFPRDVTPNSTFIQHDLLEPLPFEDNTFDYVHCRNALMEYNTLEWTEKIIPEMIRVTRPLGFVEHCEVDEHHVNEGPIMKEITDTS
jgi:ubiquinone/menaquinone biosynthesis C-methylase UbiE